MKTIEVKCKMDFELFDEKVPPEIVLADLIRFLEREEIAVKIYDYEVKDVSE